MLTERVADATKPYVSLTSIAYKHSTTCIYMRTPVTNAHKPIAIIAITAIAAIFPNTAARAIRALHRPFVTQTHFVAPTLA